MEKQKNDPPAHPGKSPYRRLLEPEKILRTVGWYQDPGSNPTRGAIIINPYFVHESRGGIIDSVDREIKGNNILIVVDVNDSGKTLKIASDHVHASNPTLFRTAVLHEKKTTRFNTGYTEKILERKNAINQ